MELPRRHFFLLLSGALLQPVTDRVQRDMVVRSVRPEDLEMPLSGFSDYITPIERFFVRTHVYAPRVDLNRVATDGRRRSRHTAHADHGRRETTAGRRARERPRVCRQRARLLRALDAGPAVGQWSRRQRALARREAGRRPQAGRREGVCAERSSSTVRMFRLARCRISSVRFRSRKRSMPHASRLRDERRDASREARLPACASWRRAGQATAGSNG